jgi:threonine dehydratase
VTPAAALETSMAEPFPTLAEIEQTARQLAPHIAATPVAEWVGGAVASALGPEARVTMKLELLQRTGTFKARGAMSNATALPEEARRRGLTAVSAGNHAIAAAWAARRLGVPAKVVMLASANPLRIAMARAEGAEVVIAKDGAAGFAEAERLQKEEGLTFIPPFEGPGVARGTGTLGAEIVRQISDLDAVVVSVGGGGLAGGMAHAIKLLRPAAKVYGVEPVGAAEMRRSLDAGSPQRMEKVETIADSLAPPFTLPYVFELCRASLDDVVTVDDDLIAAGLAVMQRDVKLAVEPAAGAAAAAMLGPLRNRFRGKRVALVVCGANIDAPTYARHLARGDAALARLTG